MVDRETSLLASYFARFLAARSSLAEDERQNFTELVERLLQAMESGDSCLPLSAREQQLVNKCPLVSTADLTPLILYQGKLYLHRYANYEKRLASRMVCLAASCEDPGEEELLTRLFPSAGEGEVDWQRQAAVAALGGRLTLISGGPGTGKTTTVVKILALLINKLGPATRIALAAPTGKAAMRLRESVVTSLAGLAIDDWLKEGIPVEGMTLHRLLGVRSNSIRFRYHQDNPLPWDVVIVDEASMVDLAMMSKLVAALGPGSRLILLGDKEQLASVESGAVLADLTRALGDRCVELRKSYRFHARIGQLAGQVKEGNGAVSWQLLTDEASEELAIAPAPLDGQVLAHFRHFVEEAGAFEREAELPALFARLQQLRLLCTTSSGPRGVDNINAMVESELAAEGLPVVPGGWYPGRPVMVGSNDYSLNLYNGDVGICLQDFSGNPRVWFERSDGGYQAYSPVLLPEHQTVFAMTVHKSQGSEFEEVILVLPTQENRVLSRELLYTGITRARKRLKVVADRQIFIQAVARSTNRSSGLVERINEIIANR